MNSAEQPHFSHHGQSTNFLPDACDQPLDFQVRHDSDRESHQKINYGLAGSGGVGMMDHDPAASTVHTWTPAVPGVGFPQVPLGPAGTQFDPTFIPQASLPVQPSPSFGGIPASSFQPPVPPVSVPFGIGPGASLHSAFNGDPNGAVNLSERPKKAAVPNWLREEIIKKKHVISSVVSGQPTGNSFDSFGSEDGDKFLIRADQGDSKSMDSTKSTEDEENDEEEVEAARSAAINQEIKRILTEVLLKVTEELFDEIATKVLNEDDQNVEATEGSTIAGNQKVSPTAIPTPKAAAKVLVPVRTETSKVDGVGENSSTSFPGGNLLGLANYDSDNDDDEVIQSSKLSFGNEMSASHQHESNDKPSEKDFASVKDESDNNGVVQRDGARGSPYVDNLHYPDREAEGVSLICEEPIPVENRKVKEPPSETAISSQSNDTLGAKDVEGQESVSARSDKSHSKDYRDTELKREMGLNKNPQNRGDSKASAEKTGRQTSDASDSTIHQDKLMEKMEKRDKFKERAQDKSSERGSKLKESDSRRTSNDSIKDDRKETTKDKRDKYKEDSERKRERVGDEKDDRITRATRDSSRYISRRSPSSSSRGKNSKDNSFSRSNVSGDEPSDNSIKRKKLSHNSSSSPSPTKSRKRQDSRSPRSKHSHRRHSPYSSSVKRRRSRSISPVLRRSDVRKRGS